jgi:hypothetical protein
MASSRTAPPPYPTQIKISTTCACVDAGNCKACTYVSVFSLQRKANKLRGPGRQPVALLVRGLHYLQATRGKVAPEGRPAGRANIHLHCLLQTMHLITQEGCGPFVIFYSTTSAICFSEQIVFFLLQYFNISIAIN